MRLGMKRLLGFVMAVTVLIAALPAEQALAVQDRCESFMKSVYGDDYVETYSLIESRKAADWKGWDRLIERLRKHNCDYLDFGVSMSASSQSVAVGSTVTFTVVAENTGTLPGRIDMINSLPLEVEFVSGSWVFDSGTATDLNCAMGDPDQFDWWLAYCRRTVVEPGYVSMTYTVRPLETGSFTNTAFVRNNGIAGPQLPDFDPRNNTSSVTVEVTN